jgi:hypothetical protein
MLQSGHCFGERFRLHNVHQPNAGVKARICWKSVVEMTRLIG